MSSFRNKPRAACLIAALLASPSCLAVTLERERFERKPSVEALEGLLAGHVVSQVGDQIPFANLADALAELGAPLHVAPLPRDATALVYGWQATTHLRASLSLPLAKQLVGSLDISRRREHLDGLVLIFDGAGTLRGSRAGKLIDISSSLTDDRPFYDDAWWEEE